MDYNPISSKIKILNPVFHMIAGSSCDAPISLTVTKIGGVSQVLDLRGLAQLAGMPDVTMAPAEFPTVASRTGAPA